MGVVTPHNQRIVQRPSGDRLLLAVDFKRQRRSLADDEVRIKNAPHLLPDAISRNGSDEAEIAYVDPKNWNARTAKAMSRLKQSPVAAAGDYEIRLQIA